MSRGGAVSPAAVRNDAVAVGLPRWTYLPAALAVALLVLPLAALLIKADWAQVPRALVSEESRAALWLSLKCGIAATLLCLLLGTPLAIVLSRGDGAGSRIVRALVTVPLVLPPMVGGIALLYLLGVNGLAGHYLFVWFGARIAFTTIAVVIAETFVALPFLVLTLEGAVRSVGSRYEAVAATLGAGRWTVLRRVTLPLLGPAIATGTALCFARALGEFGATALFAGNAQGVTRTMPLAIYTAFNGAGASTDAAVAMSLLLILLAVAILIWIRPRRSPV
ncbi:ABC transporter permease [Nakamurella lactea]|uniref:ABC transporter permease n=1 Tax=Nakamurella lactea TaxID=459515 RepID=UPI00041B705D|nr:ABC transporter permease [Nakamurella lactea]